MNDLFKDVELDWKNTKDIIIDPEIQRDLEGRRAQYNKIKKDFNVHVVQAIQLARLNGRYYCYDGQLTMTILKDINGKKDLMVPCMIHSNLTREEVADLFCEQRGYVSRVLLSDQIEVQAAAGGDVAARKFKELNRRNHFRTDAGKNCDKSLIHIQATKALWTEFQKMTENQYDAMMRILYEAFRGCYEQICSKVIRGLGLFIETYDKKYNEKTLISALSKVRPSDIIRDAEADRSAGYGKYARQILYLYNKGLRANKLENILG